MAFTGVMTVVGTLLSIIVGLWKFFGVKAREKRRKKKEGYDEAKSGLQKDDVSEITAGVDNLNNA